MTNDKMPDVIYLVEHPEFEDDDDCRVIWTVDPDCYSGKIITKYIRSDLHDRRVTELLEANNRLVEENRCIKRENEELRAKLDKAKDALGFYSISWVNQSYGSDDGKPSHRLTKDKGHLARTTLEELK